MSVVVRVFLVVKFVLVNLMNDFLILKVLLLLMFSSFICNYIEVVNIIIFLF